ncbi:hypothetical protein QQ045_001793 [Rhodiola kirilowii]
MADLGSVGAMEKLNEYNYQKWRSCMKSYLGGQDLWDIVDGCEISPPSKDDKSYKLWNIKADKALYAMKISIDKLTCEDRRCGYTERSMGYFGFTLLEEESRSTSTIGKGVDEYDSRYALYQRVFFSK